MSSAALRGRRKERALPAKLTATTTGAVRSMRLTRARVMKLDSLSFDIDTSKCLARAKQVVPEIAGVCV